MLLCQRRSERIRVRYRTRLIRRRRVPARLGWFLAMLLSETAVAIPESMSRRQPATDAVERLLAVVP
jgi:hypothetical protein